MAGPAGPNVDRQDVTLFNLNYAWSIAAFFALSALAQSLVAKTLLAWQIFASTLASTVAD